MSFVIAAPEVMAAAATDLANIGSSISAASAAAAGPTMGILAAGADEVSVAISALFGSHAQGYQTLSAQLAPVDRQRRRRGSRAKRWARRLVVRQRW